MIEKIDEIDIETFPMGDAGAQFLTILAHVNGAKRKINELVDKVNDLTTNLDGQARTLIEQQDKIAILEEHAHPTATTEPADSYAEQRKWVGCLVRYKICNWEGGWRTDVLDDIVDHPIYPFKMRNGDTAQVCELVTADEIYPNKARTW